MAVKADESVASRGPSSKLLLLPKESVVCRRRSRIAVEISCKAFANTNIDISPLIRSSISTELFNWFVDG
jgi:hypothetical protein